MKDMQLSAHFWLHEFVYSPLAARLGIDNTPDAQAIENLARLCTDLLEPVRATLGHRVMAIDSGYRCAALNLAAHGASHSAHLDGRAADFRVEGMAPKAVCQALSYVDWPNLDQCIFEQTWTHLAVCPPLGKPRREFLTATFTPQGVTYARGIPT